MRIELLEKEKDLIWKSIERHPTVLVKGPSYIGITRIKETLKKYHLTQNNYEEADLIIKNNHPDIRCLDSRQLDTSEAREAKEGLSVYPARWSHRYLILGYAEKLHNIALQTLLKLIEEPPKHLRIFLTSEAPYSLPETIFSRSILS